MLCLCFIFVACTTKEHRGSIPCDSENSSLKVDTSLLENGDLAFRCGYGLESRAVTSASGGAYSHVGILCHDRYKGWMVIHAVPGETKDKDGVDRVKYEPVDSFYSCLRASCGAVARVDCDSRQKIIAIKYALDMYSKGVPFDNDYILNDSSAVYCTELVWRSFNVAGVQLAKNITHLNPIHPTRGNEVLYPSDIFASKLLREISAF